MADPIALLACLFKRHRWRVFDQADQAPPPPIEPPYPPWGTASDIYGCARTGPRIRVVCQRCGARAFAEYQLASASDAWLKGRPEPEWRLVAPWGGDVDGALTHVEVEDRQRCRRVPDPDAEYDEGRPDLLHLTR